MQPPSRKPGRRAVHILLTAAVLMLGLVVLVLYGMLTTRFLLPV